MTWREYEHTQRRVRTVGWLGLVVGIIAGALAGWLVSMALEGVWH
jgi:hypothetical protein